MKTVIFSWKPAIKSKFLTVLLAWGTLVIPSAFASDDLWVGNTSINWNTAVNWSPAAVPVAGDNLYFGAAGSAGATLTNDIAAGTSFAGVTFNSGASAFTLIGNSIGVTSGITNNSGGTEIVSNNITLGGNVTVNTGVGGTTMLASLITGSFGLTNAGSGMLILQSNVTFGAGGSTFSGGLTVNGGTVAISTPEHDGVTFLGIGPLTVNAGGTLTNSGDGFGFAGNACPTNIFINGGTINCGTGTKGSSSGTGAGTLPNITFVNGGTLTIFGTALGTLGGNNVAMGITNFASSTTAVMNADPSATANWNNTKPTTFNVAQGTVAGGLYPGVDMYFSARLNHSGIVVKTGAGTLELAGINPMNSGGGNSSLTINSGSVVVSGSLPSTCIVTNAGGVLCGSNSVAGMVTNVNSAAQINQETNYLITGTAGTLTIGGALNMSVGGTCALDLSTSASSGNDSIKVNGALILGSGTVFHLKALSGAANLDTTADYILIQGSSVPSGSANSAPVWDGTPPANSGSYFVQIIGNNVVFHYAPPFVPYIRLATAAPSPATNGQNVLLAATVTNGMPPYTVTVDASSVGASSSVGLVLQGSGLTPGVGYVYTNTIAVGINTPGSYLLPVTATDTAAQTGSNNIPLAVAVYLTWNGDAGGNSFWDTAGEIEWKGGLAYADGDTVRFDDTAGGLDATNVNLLAALSPGGSIVVSNTAGTPTGVYSFNSTDPATGINGTNGVLKQGSGTLLMLEGSDNFSGGIVVGGGALLYSNIFASTVTVAGGLTVTNGGSVMLDHFGTISGNTVIGTGSSLQIGANDIYGNLPSGSVTLNGTLIFNRTDPVVSVGGVISGTTTGILVQSNADIVALGGASTFAGNINVYAGTLSNNISSGTDVGPGSSTGGFGGAGTGRTITVAAGATLSGRGNNWFGRGTNGVPAIIVNGGTVFASRYTALGNLTLNNGATLSQAGSSSDSAVYQGYELLGSVTVGGSSASTITSLNGTNDCLGTNTLFNIAVTSGSGADLTVSTGLRDQSGDFGGAAGGLTKAGLGTMLLTAANSYRGNTVVSAGVLALGVNGPAAGTIASSNIVIAGGATLDVSGLTPGFALGAGQTLSNSTSTAVLNGNFDVSLGIDSLNYTSGTPSFTIRNGTLTLAATSVFNVNNTGAPLAAGSYKIISKGTGGSVVGTVPAAVRLVGTPGMAGTLQITSGELYLVLTVLSHPVFTGLTVSGPTLTLTATNGAHSRTFTLLGSTNVALPLTQWTPVLTNAFDSNGHLNMSTNIINTNNQQQFYILWY